MSSIALGDRSTRARLRDTAIEVFARDGFGATVRTIAAEADVSPGLVIHHFGSKDKLRAECDAYVLERVRESGMAGVRPAAGPDPFATFLTQMDELDDAGPRIVYLLRSLRDGGSMARELLDHLAADAETTLRTGVAQGTVRPSADESGRARYLVAQSLGAMLVDLVAHPPLDWSDAEAIIRGYLDRSVIPATEMAVHGVMADDRLLDAVLAYRRDGNDSDSRDNSDGDSRDNSDIRTSAEEADGD